MSKEGLAEKAPLAVVQLVTIKVVLYGALFGDLPPNRVVSGMNPQEWCALLFVRRRVAKGFQVSPLNVMLRLGLPGHTTSFQSSIPCSSQKKETKLGTLIRNLRSKSSIGMLRL